MGSTHKCSRTLTNRTPMPSRCPISSSRCPINSRCPISSRCPKTRWFSIHKQYSLVQLGGLLGIIGPILGPTRNVLLITANPRHQPKQHDPLDGQPGCGCHRTEDAAACTGGVTDWPPQPTEWDHERDRRWLQLPHEPAIVGEGGRTGRIGEAEHTVPVEEGRRGIHL